MRTVIKVLAVLTVVALIGAAVTLVVVAQGRGEGTWGAGRRGGMMGPGTGQAAGPQVERGGTDARGTDADGDGLCDICGEAMGEGREGRGQGLGREGDRGVDADGDGVCDVCGEECDAEGERQGDGPRYGQQQGGRGMGRGMGRGRGQTQPQAQPEGQSD